MPTVRQYYESDFKGFLGPEGIFPLQNKYGKELSPPVLWKLLLGYDSRAAFYVCYVPTIEDHQNAVLAIIENFDWLLKIKGTIKISEGFSTEPSVSLDDCVFTGRLIIYVEAKLDEDAKKMLLKLGEERKISVLIRDTEYMKKMEKRQKPLAFISHDWRDKDEIAKPLAICLTQNLCPVWYDEFSLNIGDNLRDSIEKGLKESKKCILILTPNFLSNTGWTKIEFDSIFTREILEKENLFLPIWNNVTPKDVANYSPSLANRLGINWSLGVEEVTKKLLKSLL